MRSSSTYGCLAAGRAPAADPHTDTARAPGWSPVPSPERNRSHG